MQEGNWGDIEKVFQKTHVYLWFIYHNITNSQAVLAIVVTPWFVATFNCYFLDKFLHPATPQLLSIIQKNTTKELRDRQREDFSNHRDYERELRTVSANIDMIFGKNREKEQELEKEKDL